MKEERKIRIFYSKDHSFYLNSAKPNCFFLNENRGHDKIDPLLGEKLETELESSLDSLCDYYNEFQKKAEDVLLEKCKFLLSNQKRTWLLSKIFNRDIESTNSRIRLIAYLEFLKNIQRWIEYSVTTDCEFFASLLKENGIPVNYIGSKQSLFPMFSKILILNFLLSKKFKKNKSKYRLLFLSLSANWTREKGDRHLGSLKEIRQDFSYLHFLNARDHISKFNSEEIVLNSFLRVKDFLEVFLKSIYFYFRILLVGGLFLEFRKMNLSSLLRMSLLEMSLDDYPSGFFYSRSIKNYFLEDEKENLKLFTYGELFPINLFLYSDLHELKHCPFIVALQHAIIPKRKLVDHHNYLFSGGELPDHYLVHGELFARELRKNNPNLKLKVIGCLKYDGIAFTDLSTSENKNKVKVLIAPSLNDFDSIYESLEGLDVSQLQSFEFFISIHPAANLEFIKEKLIKLPFKINIVNHMSSLEFAKQCDIVIFSYSSVGLEALFYNKKIIRVYSKKLPKLFDDDSRIPTASSSVQLEKALNNENKMDSEEIIRDYFGFIDGLVYRRFSDFLNQLN